MSPTAAGVPMAWARARVEAVEAMRADRELDDVVRRELNERAYLVSVVATIFVPLTFLTGFLGMNFGWMVDHIHSGLAFVVLGVLTPVAMATWSGRLLVRGLVIGDGRRSRRHAQPPPTEGRRPWRSRPSPGGS